MKNGKRRGQKKQKRKGAYDKSGGITHDTAAFAFRTKDILKIRSCPQLEPGSDYHYLCVDVTDDTLQTACTMILHGLHDYDVRICFCTILIMLLTIRR